MPYAVELLLDRPTDRKVRKMGDRLEKQDVPTLFSFPGGEPHVALAVFETCDLPRLKTALRKISSKITKFEVRLSSVGSFPGDEGVIFLAPVVTPILLRLNVLVHDQLGKFARGSWDYYKPGWWVPHCTLSMKLSPREMVRGLALIKKMDFGLAGRFNRLVLVKVSGNWPPDVQVLYSTPLTGKIKLTTKGK